MGGAETLLAVHSDRYRYREAVAAEAKSRREGAFILFVRVWLLLNASNVLRYKDSWPIFLIGWGISIAWNAIVPAARRGVNDD